MDSIFNCILVPMFNFIKCLYIIISNIITNMNIWLNSHREFCIERLCKGKNQFVVRNFFSNIGWIKFKVYFPKKLIQNCLNNFESLLDKEIKIFFQHLNTLCDVHICWSVLDFKKLEISKGKYRLNAKLV